MSEQKPPGLPPKEECPYCEEARKQAMLWRHGPVLGCFGHYPGGHR